MTILHFEHRRPPAMREERWRIALTEPNREGRAIDGLMRLGIPSYLPIVSVRKMCGRRVRVVQASMFPGYLFVKFSLDLPGWGKIRNVSGLRSSPLMRPSNKEGYVELTDFQMEAIMFTERRIAGEKNVQSKSRGLKLGDEVRIRVGKQFAEVLAKIETLDDDERIGVMYKLFGKELRETLPLDRLAV
jgi:transcriptional antiterminator RfaH